LLPVGCNPELSASNQALSAGGTVTYRGKHLDVESAKVWDLPDTAPAIGIGLGRCHGVTAGHRVRRGPR
jgi:hypothetical protein